MNSHTLAEFWLECSHVVHFRSSKPSIGDNIYCVACENMRRVIGRTGTFHATCSRCTFHRYLVNFDTVIGAIRTHLQRAPRHVVIVSQLGTSKRWTVKLDTPDTEDNIGPTLSQVESPDVLL